MSPKPQSDPAGVNPSPPSLPLSRLEGLCAIAVGTSLSTELLLLEAEARRLRAAIATAAVEIESYTAVVGDLESQLQATVLYIYG